MSNLAVIPYGGNFKAAAVALLAGKARQEVLGDSQTTRTVDYLWCDWWIKTLPIKYHYFLSSAANNTAIVDSSNAGTAWTQGAGTALTLDCASATGDGTYNYVRTSNLFTGVADSVITTTADHGLAVGDAITITASTSGIINGSFTVTSIPTSTTFTCGVNGGAGGITATITVKMSARVMMGVRATRFTGTVADNTGTTLTGNIVLNKQLQNNPAHDQTHIGFAWPTFADTGKPWFHNDYMKARIVYWVATANALTKFQVRCRRQGSTSANNSNSDTNGVEHVVTASADRIAASSWSSVVADLGAPQAITSNSAASPTEVTTAGSHGLVSNDWVHIVGQSGSVSINGLYKITKTAANKFTIVVDCTGGAGTGGTLTACHYDLASATLSGPQSVGNDHELGIQLISTGDGTSYNETGKIIMPMAGMFARCNSGGTVLSNADGSRASYSIIGRGGAGVSEWLNYCTQQDWQDWFTATILDESPLYFVDTYLLGHNLNGSTVDVGDGDGALAEQTANRLNTTTWVKRYTALVNRRKAAFLAAFPNGNYMPILLAPWPTSFESSAMDTATPLRIADVNAAVKQVAGAVGAGWFSWTDAFAAADGTARDIFPTVHSWTNSNGAMLARALLDALHHSTGYQYTSIGSWGGLGRSMRV